MANGNGTGSLTFKWLVGILVTVLILMVGAYFANLESRVNGKVDKETYCADIREIKIDLKEIKNWHLPPELRDKR